MADRPAPAGTSNSRRLVAVWFADIVGYSSLSSRDESAALQQIHNFQAACQDAVSAHGGRLVKYLGDAAFAEFPSTEAAVRAAQSLCEHFSDDGGLLRIGVHVGDVVTRPDGDLFGDGVNTASRLQVEARPGQILVSGDVWRQLRSVRGLDFQRIGRKELRGIEHPIELFAVVGQAEERSGGGGVVGFVRELRRRYVFRAGLVYLIAAWLVIQVAVAVAGPLGLPSWTATMVIVLAALGFPIALVLAWAFEITPEGIVPTSGRSAVKPSFTGASARAVTQPEPARLHQSAPPAPPPALRGVPFHGGSFLGRETEIERLRDLLRSREERLVTVTGPGGIGKTSLAIRVAEETAQDFRDGAVFVPLAAQTSAASVLPAVAEQLGITLNVGTDARMQVKDFLREKEILVVLDNFEQLAQHAAFLAEMIDTARGLRLLVTSRHRLNLKCEAVFPLDGLSQTPSSGSSLSDAEQLFFESAKRNDPSFAQSQSDEHLIRELCQYLEGVPLAIELAASWARVLSCAEILREVRQNLDFLSRDLRDVPERHRSLEAAFDSSWRLLSDAERRYFRRLSVFVGGFDKKAAAEVAEIGYPGLLSLVDQSLIRRSAEDRFEMLDVLRQFANEKLAEDAHEERWIGEKHCDYYVAAAAAEFPSDQPPTVDADGVVSRDIENLKAAWRWAIKESAFKKMDLAIDGVFEHYHRRGRSLEGEELFAAAEEALVAAGSQEPEVERIVARIRLRCGIFNHYLARYEKAEQLIRTAQADLQTDGRGRELALATEYLGWIALYRGQYEKAKAAYQNSYQLYESLSLPRGMGRALVGLGNLAYSSGDFEEAKHLYERSTLLQREANDHAGLASSLCNLGIIAATTADYETANLFLNESLQVAQSVDNQRAIANALQNLGATAYRAGDLEAAETHSLRGIELCRQMGHRRAVPAFLNILAAVYEQSGRESDAASTYRESLDAAIDIGETPAILEALFCCGRLIGRIDPERGIATLSFILSHPATDQSTRVEAQQLAKKLGNELPERDVAVADQRGRSMSLSAAVDNVRHHIGGATRATRITPSLSTPERAP